MSNSEIMRFDRCRRAWLVEYYFGLAPAAEIPFSHRLQGTRIHTALEGHYGYGLDPVAVLGVLYRQAIEQHPQYEPELRAEWDQAQIKVSGYLEWVDETGQDADLEVVAVEQDVQVPCPGMDGVMLRARLDQAVRRASDGAIGFLDYKNSATFNRHELLALDPQMRFYCLVQALKAVQDGERTLVTGGFINTLRRCKRTAASKPPYYQRDAFWYTPEQMSATLARVQQVAAEIVAARKHLDHVTSPPYGLADMNALQRGLLHPTPLLHDCSWSCPLAQGACTAMDDGSDWPGLLWSSGHFERRDPYAHYSDDTIAQVRKVLEAGYAGATDQGDDQG